MSTPRPIVHHGDCLAVLRTLPDESIDAVVTDPPYGLSNTDPKHVAETLTKWVTGDHEYTPPVRSGGFMGAKWDAFVPPPAVWDECMRVLKPGGHLLVFAGTRTQDLMGLSIRLAGFDIRDGIGWIYGSGFPKSMDVSKAIDKVRDDHPEIRVVCRAIRAAMDAKGLRSKDLVEHFDDCHPRLIDHWAARDTDSQPSLPKWDQWETLRGVLDLGHEHDAEVWRLNGRKGTPGENWDKREVIGTRTTGIGTGKGTVAYISDSDNRDITAPATPEAERWAGWGTALKPAIEPVIHARKPLSVVPSGGELDKLHHLIGGLLWLSLSPAKRADVLSTSSPAGLHEGTCASALVNAVLATSPDASAATDMYRSPGLARTSSSIASSWNVISAGLSDPTTMSTTATGSSTTTALTTLSSLLGPLTSQTTTPPCACRRGGPSSHAQSAVSNSSAEWSTWLHTLSASVPETAIEGTALAVASALAAIVGSLSDAPAGGSSAGQSATTEADESSPAIEPVIVARKPIKGTIAANVLAHGTGGINVDGCRVGTEVRHNPSARNGSVVGLGTEGTMTSETEGRTAVGRFPPNVLLDPEAAAAMDEQSGVTGAKSRVGARSPKVAGTFGDYEGQPSALKDHGDSGGASRFFPVFKYQAKAPAKERPQYTAEDGRVVKHATVKPLELMRWLVRLVTPPGGVVLDPFAGSGTTGEAAMLEGFDSILVEGEAEHLPLIDVRIERSADETTASRPEAPEPTPHTLHDRIKACTSRADLADLYDEVTTSGNYGQAWTDEHTAAGTAHLATIERITP